MKRIAVLIYGYKNTYGWRRTHYAFSQFKETSVTYIPRKYNNLLDIFRFFFLTMMARPQYIYLLDVGLPTALATLFIKLFRWNTKIILDTADLPYYIAKFDKAPGYVVSLLYLTEKIAHGLADAIIVSGTYHKKILEEGTYLKKYKNVHFIPPLLDTSRFKPMKVDSLRKKINPKNSLLMGVTGYFFWVPQQKFALGNFMVRALEFLKDLNIKVIIIGDGPGLEKSKALAKELGVEKSVIYTGRLPYDDIPKYLNLIDIFVFTNSPDMLNNQIRTCNKYAECLSSGRYMIATNTKEVLRTLPGIGSVLKFNGLYDEYYPKKLANEVRRLYKNKELLNVKQKARAVAEKEYEYKMLSNKIKIIFEGLEN